jgi:NAD(P)-dependent dehydrogenase (short-subunit alcohol dehydrogenase family)
MDELSGKVAVVTGAASGIGLALCERLAAEGMHLVMADVQAERLDSAARSLNRPSSSTVVTVPADVRRFEDVERLADTAWERFGGADVLCNNAGVALLGAAWRLELSEWRWMLDVNLWGVIHGVKAFLPRMIDRGVPAHVVNTASISGLIGLPLLAPYAASKAAVVALSESLVRDLRGRNLPIEVSVICPGPVTTNLQDNSFALQPHDTRPKRVLPEDPAEIPPAVVAELAVRAIREARFWVVPHDDYEPALRERLDAITGGGEAVPSTL